MKKRMRAAEDETLQAYLREISAYPSLTAEEERDLGRRIRRHRDQRALRRLVESNLRAVVAYARTYRAPGVLFLDLIDEANVGLMEAARHFDPERDGQFSLYARWWIREAILHALAEHGRIFVAPRRVSPLVRAQLPPGDRTAPGAESDFRASAATLVSEPSVREVMLAYVRDALYDLTPRERQVIRLRLGLDGCEPLTSKAAAEHLGVSHSRLQQTEERAHQKLRRSQKARELRGALN